MKQPTRFEIPEQLREAADRSVEQAKNAFEQFLDATHKAVAGAEGSARSMGEGAADVQRQALAFAEENITASFDLARNLARARTVEEVTALQQEFFQRRATAAVEQGKQLGGMAARAAGTAASKPKK